MLSEKEATIFHIYGNKILHIKPSKLQAFFHKIFEEFNNDLYLSKSEVTTIKKCKIFNISLNIVNFWKMFLTEPHTYLYNTLCTSHDFCLSCFESGHISQKIWLFGEIDFVILFWTRSGPTAVKNKSEKIKPKNDGK